MPAHLKITNSIYLNESELEFNSIRAQGAGGQNVNKVSSAIHLRFDLNNSSLPEQLKEQIKQKPDQRISTNGVIIIKAQRFRTQEKNKQDAIERLIDLLRRAATTQPKRIPTKPSRNAKNKRTDQKTKRGQLKRTRSKFNLD